MSSEAEEIEKKSFQFIENKISSFPFPEREILKRVIHATGDEDFSNLIIFKGDAIQKGIEAIKNGKHVITDVNMVKVGINSEKLMRYGGKVKCFIDKEEVFSLAEKQGITRARAAFRLFSEELKDNIVVIGNSPTALLELCTLILAGIRPVVVIASPVGFVNAKESKEQILKYNVPSITVKSNKGGSTIAVAIVNALINLAEEK